ncbi:alpha/beta fold hydrolase [Pseudomonas sp. PS02288]|uniref:alpha/beta fold hydrolase n=1 Tax=Pseudomonas sp. PS02288 TaxID=2991443 RepID=UPI00249A79E7|nr:alpha/beta fold hydrolase [Pseudomonas sp. PS02288]
MPECAHVVLIHGAWAGGWVWDGLLPTLRDAGYRPHAPDLIGNGSDAVAPGEVTLEGYREQILALIAALDGKVHLVAHSGGGLTATAVGEAAPERIASVSYVAGMMLPSGLGFTELCAQLSAEGEDVSGIGPYLQPVDGGCRVPPQAARDIFFHDAPAEAARRAAERLVMQPDGGRQVSVQWSAERFGRLPRLYIEARADRSVTLAAQRRMQQQVPGAQVVSLACGHVPQLAAPDHLASALLGFFAQTDSFLA